MLTDALLRVRYRASGDTAAIHVDLPGHARAPAVRDEYDVDQVLEWAQLDDDTLVLSGAQILHVSALLACGELRLPCGAINALQRVLSTPNDRVSERCCEIEVRCSLDALSMPSAPHHSPAWPAVDTSLDPFAADAWRELTVALAAAPGHIAGGAHAALRLACASSASVLSRPALARPTQGRQDGGMFLPTRSTRDSA